MVAWVMDPRRSRCWAGFLDHPANRTLRRRLAAGKLDAARTGTSHPAGLSDRARVAAMSVGGWSSFAAVAFHDA
jgi:hypothetical protein